MLPRPDTVGGGAVGAGAAVGVGDVAALVPLHAELKAPSTTTHKAHLLNICLNLSNYGTDQPCEPKRWVAVSLDKRSAGRFITADTWDADVAGQWPRTFELRAAVTADYRKPDDVLTKIT